MPWKHGEVQALIKAARTVQRSSYMEIKAAPLSTTKPRLVVVTPKKLGSAPVRNRSKRRLRHVVQKVIFSHTPCDLVIFVRKEFESLSFDQLYAFFTGVHHKIQMLLGTHPE